MRTKNSFEKPMKRIISMFLLGASALAAVAQGSFVIPNNLANVEGNSSLNDFLNSPSFRMQLVFDASQFAIPAGSSGRIDSISFRIDGSSTAPGVQYVFGGGSVTASLTPVGPDGLSSIFANNVGANAVTIYNGALNFGAAYQSGQNPQPFAPNVSATTAFWYNPQQGNLLLDIRGGGVQVFFPGDLDAHSLLGDSISRVFANSSSATSGSADTIGLVTRIDFTVVPEPSTWALLLVGSSLLLLHRRRIKP